MKLRTKLALFSVTTVADSIGVLGWGISGFVLQQLEGQARRQWDWPAGGAGKRTPSPSAQCD